MAQLVGRRRGQTAGGGSIPRWSASKPQVVTRRKAKGAGQKKKDMAGMIGMAQTLAVYHCGYHTLKARQIQSWTCARPI